MDVAQEMENLQVTLIFVVDVKSYEIMLSQVCVLHMIFFHKLIANRNNTLELSTLDITHLLGLVIGNQGPIPQKYG